MEANPTSTTLNHQLLGWPSQALLGESMQSFWENPPEDACIAFTTLLAALSIQLMCSHNDSVSACLLKFSLCFSVWSTEFKKPSAARSECALQRVKLRVLKCA